MISNEKMEKLWWQYKNEGVAKNLSMQAFCSMHNVPYNAFEKYLKLRRHFSDVHHITVTDIPEPEDTQTDVATVPTVTPEPKDTAAVSSSSEGPESVRIMISIRMSNGMQIFRKNMDYRQLHSLVEKLEVLC